MRKAGQFSITVARKMGKKIRPRRLDRRQDCPLREMALIGADIVVKLTCW